MARSRARRRGSATTWQEEPVSTETKAKKEPLPYTAQQRVQAVLSLWTERRRPADLCQELAISPKVLAHWEARALTAMLQALETPAGREPVPALSPKLERVVAP